MIISPRSFRVENNININQYAHPHASSGDGTPCFGDGEARKKIYDLLSTNKFSDVAELLWFWIKTYRNEGAHLKHWSAYRSLLEQGYPIWDEKGKRIELNEPARLK